MSDETTTDSPLENDLRTIFSKHYLRLELVPYPDPQTLHKALLDRAIHTTIAYPPHTDNPTPTEITTRIQRLYEIMQPELPSDTNLTYLNPLASKLTVTEPQP